MGEGVGNFHQSLLSYDGRMIDSVESHLLARHTIFTDIYRWTAVWLTVHTGMAVNAPPIESVQNVYWMVGSGLKLGKQNMEITSANQKLVSTESLKLVTERVT